MPIEVAQALAKAQREARAVEKRNRNDQHNYNYASAEDVIAAARDALATAELALAPGAFRFRRAEGTLDENAGAIGYLDITYLLVHAPSGKQHQISLEEAVCPTPGRMGGWARPLDKAIFAARTESLGYMLRELLLIPRRDAPDVSGRGDADERGRAPQGQRGAPQDRRQQEPRGQDRGRCGQAPPGPSRATQGAPAQGGGQVSPPSDPKLAEEARLLRQRREEAAQQKSRDLMLQADTAFAAFVEGYAAGLTSPASVDELAAACSDLGFPKGPARDAIRSAITMARARIAAATQTT